MHAGHHIFTLNSGLPPTLVDRLLTAAEQVLTEAGASRIWVDPDVSRTISVCAHLGEPRLASQGE